MVVIVYDFCYRNIANVGKGHISMSYWDTVASFKVSISERSNIYSDKKGTLLSFHVHAHTSDIHSQILSRTMIKINNIVNLPVLLQHFPFEKDKLSLCYCYFNWSFKKKKNLYNFMHKGQKPVQPFR